MPLEKRREGSSSPRDRLLPRYLLLLLILPFISCIMYFNLENPFGYQKSQWQTKLAGLNANKKTLDLDYLS